MVEKLKDKVAIVTGSGDGIGRAMVLAMVAEGAKVVVNDINKEAADKAVSEIAKVGGEAIANYDSVATMAGGEEIIKTATKNFGRIDILVNNAGNFFNVPTLEMTEKQWDSIMNVHLKGHFACSKAAVSEMIKQKSGRIINISSRASFFGNELAYCTAKAGVLGFTTSLSNELKDYGITVNAILPRAKTKLFPAPIVAKTRIPGMPTAPPKQPLGPEYVPPIIVYLSTDEAKNITGRFFLAEGEDIVIFARPLSVPGGAHTCLYKQGIWTLDELSHVIPPLAENK